MMSTSVIAPKRAPPARAIGKATIHGTPLVSTSSTANTAGTAPMAATAKLMILFVR